MLPSANAWAQALAAHLTFMLCALLPTSILLYHIVPGRARTLMGIVIALGQALHAHGIEQCEQVTASAG